jgi:hypothetical protein
MPDQTRNDWVPLQRSELGTLVLVSENRDVPQLLRMTGIVLTEPPGTDQYASETFNFDDEELTKFYFSKMPYAFVAEGRERLAAYSYAWIPEGRDFFKGKCGGEDCTASRICRRPGCVCTPSKFSSAWKCR